MSRFDFQSIGRAIAILLVVPMASPVYYLGFWGETNAILPALMSLLKYPLLLAPIWLLAWHVGSFTKTAVWAVLGSLYAVPAALFFGEMWTQDRSSSFTESHLPLSDPWLLTLSLVGVSVLAVGFAKLLTGGETRRSTLTFRIGAMLVGVLSFAFLLLAIGLLTIVPLIVVGVGTTALAIRTLEHTVESKNGI